MNDITKQPRWVQVLVADLKREVSDLEGQLGRQAPLTDAERHVENIMCSKYPNVFALDDEVRIQYKLDGLSRGVIDTDVEVIRHGDYLTIRAISGALVILPSASNSIKIKVDES